MRQKRFVLRGSGFGGAAPPPGGRAGGAGCEEEAAAAVMPTRIPVDPHASTGARSGVVTGTAFERGKVGGKCTRRRTL